MLAAVAVVATACGGSGSGSLGGNALEKAIEAETGHKVDLQQDGDGFTVETDEGSITFGANGDSTDITGTDAQGNKISITGGTDVPADFPLPVPDNVEISSVTTFDMPQGKSFGVIFDFDPSRVEEIANLYRDALKSQALNIEDNGPGVDSMVIVGSNDAVNVIVRIDNYGGYWEANISWTPA